MASLVERDDDVQMGMMTVPLGFTFIMQMK